MLFSALFPLAGRRAAARPADSSQAAGAGAPSADSLRVTASALRAWGAEVDAESLEDRAARIASS